MVKMQKEEIKKLRQQLVADGNFIDSEYRNSYIPPFNEGVNKFNNFEVEHNQKFPENNIFLSADVS